jgi:hypothetical protein
MMRFLPVLYIMSLFGWVSPSLSFTEIPIRPARDGAGPSHIFHLRDDLIAVVDPLEGQVRAYRPGKSGAARTASSPPGERPWRIVRKQDIISLIVEGERRRIDIPRDVSRWPQNFEPAEHDPADPAFKPPQVKRNRADRMTLQPTGGLPALTIRSVGPTYLASARELERTPEGRRHVLWKEVRLTEASNPRDRKLQVEVYVGRFEPGGRLSGLASLPRKRMSRIGFDYASILPDGQLVLLASLDRTLFKIVRVAFDQPPRRRVTNPPADAELASVIEPDDGQQISLGEDNQPARGEVAGDVPTGGLKRRDLKKAMEDYRDHVWTLRPMNMRNPCQTAILDGVPVSCAKPAFYVTPPRHLRQTLPLTFKGLPYDWGGADRIKVFDNKIAANYTAGNIGDTFWSKGARDVTAGVDCSGLVSNVWRLGIHISTDELDKVTDPVPTLSQLRVGDALLLAGHHVVLYQEQVLPDGASLAIRVTEAASRCGSVCESLYEIDQFHDYTLRRYKRMSPGV